MSETRSWGGVACREWFRASNPAGYGRMTDGERLQYSHRLSYEAFIGEIPAGLDVLHKCDNPACVEPKHLWSGTHQENLADMVSKGRHLAGRARAAAKRRGRPSAMRGARHPKVKLEAAKVRDIKIRLRRTLYKTNRPAALAREYGVSESLIRAIGNGKAWGWLEVGRAWGG